MRRLLKSIAILVVALLAVAVAIVIFWLKSDPAVWRGALTRFASEQLGRQLIIAGEIRPGFSFATGLTLQLTDLRLANAPGFQPPTYPASMLTVPALELTVDLRALFSNTIHIRGLKISGATLTLAQLQDGNDNWTFHKADTPVRVDQTESATKTSDGRVFTFDADRVVVVNLLVDYSAPGDKETLQVATLELQASARKPFKFKGVFQHNQTLYQVDFAAGPLKTLLEGTRQPLVLDVQSQLHKLAIRADYSRYETLHRLDALQANIDRLALKGEATVTMGAPHPRVTIRLTTPVLELPKTETVAASNANANAIPEPVFSRTPLPWSLLSSLDLDGTLEVARVTRGNEPLGPLHLDAKLARSQLAATIIAQPPGAAQPIKIGIAANAAQQASLSLTAPAIEPAVWASFLDSQPLVQSPANLSMNLAGHGAALHDLMATASGSASFSAQSGMLNAAAIPPAVRRALDAVLGPDMLNKTSLACLKGDFIVQDGNVSIGSGPDDRRSGIGLDSSILTLSGDGHIDLGAETIGLRLVVAPKLPGLLQTLVPLHITGALGDPRVSADLKAAAGQVAGQLVGRLAENLPTARLGLAAAKALGQDLGTMMIAKPYNPCIAEPATPAVVIPDAVTPPGNLPPEVQQKLKGARDILDQFIKATEPPAPPVRPETVTTPAPVAP